MKNAKITLNMIICINIAVFAVEQVSAFSIDGLLGLDKQEQKGGDRSTRDNKVSGNNSDKDWSGTADSSTVFNPQLDLQYFNLLFSNMNEQERSKVLTDPEAFGQLVENEIKNRAVLNMAISEKLHIDENIRFLMRRSAENVLREIYLKRLLLNKLPADFPAEAQIKEYYKDNEKQFIAPERMHVWQIFLEKIPDGPNITVLKEKAVSIYADLKAGRTDFAGTAFSLSDHLPSKTLGGYMGLVKTSELLPELKEPLRKLKEGKISKPIETEAGIHILKRGEIVKSETLKLKQVKNQIRQLLINQEGVRLRNELFLQARKRFPQNISDKTMEEWRLRLRTGTVK